MKSLGIIIRLSWRNAWRNKRRTLLTLLTIIVGCAMILFMNAIAKGGHDQMIEDAITINTGYIQIHEKGFWDNHTIDFAFERFQALDDLLEKHPYVAAYSDRIIAGGLVSFKEKTQGTFIQGIDPGRERYVCNFHTRILPGGRFLNNEDRLHAVFGTTLAKNLGATVGDKISILSQGFDGSIAADRFTIVGIFHSGNPEYDRNLALIPLSQADETFSMMGFIHAMVIKLDDAARMAQVKHDIIQTLSSDPQTFEVMGWDELMPELVQFIVMDDMAAYLFDLILFMLVAFGILNTIQMSIFERTREIGVMLSVGTRPGHIFTMVMVESFFVALIGIVSGIVLGYGICIYFEFNPIDFSAYAGEMAIWGVNTAIWPADITGLSIVATSLITFFLAMFFSIFPARRAAGLEPIRAIRKL